MLCVACMILACVVAVTKNAIALLLVSKTRTCNKLLGRVCFKEV